jgi:shikimate kinase
MKRHIILIGLPGAGKSAVGARTAQLLGAPFLDIDVGIEETAGRTVKRIFAEQDEATFRALEKKAVTAALGGPPAVIAPGGGWAAQPGNLIGAVQALVVHLAVRPETALARIDPSSRPLLAEDPAGAMERLAAQRLPLYRHAEATVETDGMEVEPVAEQVVRLARSLGGW